MSYVTSYIGLFEQRTAGVPSVDRIEIPLIQRDYAQGRKGEAVRRIRDNFLTVLHDAVTGGERVNLDFVYGFIREGTLQPLDGQQRLTTLFLLHWYLAFRAGRMADELGWKRFAYDTRASARLFCERLVRYQPPPDIERPSSWIEDQEWYLYTWRQDPTVQSMLVMLDAIHQRFRGDDCVEAWNRLIDIREPAITFHLLPMEETGLNEDLYIKMNSRGKPLTPFENFKARFERVLEESCPARVEEFARKIDCEWADLLWRYRGANCIVDEEFLRYFHFVTEVCEWREGRPPIGEVDVLAERVFGCENKSAATQIDFLLKALDTWVGEDIPAVFECLFAKAPAPLETNETSKVVLFAQEVDLFSACCRSYGGMQGGDFSLPQTILLYAVILQRLHQSPNFARRLRILRNLVEASGNELRKERMPALIGDVKRIVVDGSLEGVTAFNQAQIADERIKTELLARYPELERALFQLEDHPVLRGCLAAFEFDSEMFERRAGAFHKLFSDSDNWTSLTGALLATGDYSRTSDNRLFQFGSASNITPWRELLTGAGRFQLGPTREVLGRLLDEVAQVDGNLNDCLVAIQKRWLQANQEGNDLSWRHYFVKYGAMREGRSGIYVGMNGKLGYGVCMLDKRRMNSWYRDPYLQAILQESGVGRAVDTPWFTGYENEPRWMRLVRSGAALRCVEEGIALLPSTSTVHTEAYTRVCGKHNVTEDHILRVPQIEREGQLIDTSDRIQIGATLLRNMVEEGL